MVVRLLIASVGNPAPYTTTLHSAGHLLLSSLVPALGHPSLMPDSSFSSGLVSHSPEQSLYQSRSYMNVSGVNIAKAYKSFLRRIPTDEQPFARLVVLHDELEAPIGRIKMKIGGSARGHNGIKSIVGAMGGKEFVRIGVGIGRPESREKDDVANYVLKKMKPAEVEKIKGAVQEVVRLLKELKEG